MAVQRYTRATLKEKRFPVRARTRRAELSYPPISRNSRVREGKNRKLAANGVKTYLLLYTRQKFAVYLYELAISR